MENDYTGCTVGSFRPLSFCASNGVCFLVFDDPHFAQLPSYENSLGGGATVLKLFASAPRDKKPQSLQ